MKKLSENIIKDILTTALEGGISYWGILDNTTPEWVEGRKAYKERTGDEIPCYCDTAYEVLSNGKEIILIDAEAEDLDEPEEDEIYRLTMDKLLKGCEAWEQRSGKDIVETFEEGEYDADDADIIFQIGIFNGIIFG